MKNEQSLKQIIREYEQQMPADIMNEITQFDWRRELREIVRDNTVMLDVGADLEESVYMMILGVVKVEDVYLRMIEVHEVPDEKAQKILREVEQRIFNPLTKKLADLDGVEIDTESDQAEGSVTVPSAATGVSRDSILAEIEKDEEEVVRPVASNVVMPGGRTIPSASMEKVSAPTGSSQQPTAVEEATASATSPTGPMSDRLGLRDIPVSTSVSNNSKPFSISSETGIDTQKIGLDDGVTVDVPAATSAAPAVEGIQPDPITSGLTKPVSTTSPRVGQSAPKSASPAVDPYREPIE